MELINFIFYILYHFGTFFLEHTFLCIALLLIVIFAIIQKKYGQPNVYKIDTKEAQRIFSDTRSRRDAAQHTSKFECINCGAPLRAERAPCDYCGTRAFAKKDSDEKD